MNQNSPHTIDPRATYRGYGCTVCQKDHVEGDPLFDLHLYFQAKHGTYQITGRQLLVIAAMKSATN